MGGNGSTIEVVPSRGGRVRRLSFGRVYDWSPDCSPEQVDRLRAQSALRLRPQPSRIEPDARRPGRSNVRPFPRRGGTAEQSAQRLTQTAAAAPSADHRHLPGIRPAGVGLILLRCQREQVAEDEIHERPEQAAFPRARQSSQPCQPNAAEGGVRVCEPYGLHKRLHTWRTLATLQVEPGEKSRFTGTLQRTLADSNRRPPPYHGGFGASGAYTRDQSRHSFSCKSHRRGVSPVPARAQADVSVSYPRLSTV
jgi:hypothetical protein